MGFSGIVSFILLFFALLIVMSTFILIQGEVVESTNLNYEIQKERLKTEARAGIEIVNISFDNNTDPDTTTVFVLNSGSVKLETEYIDAYIDDYKVPRDTDNRTISFAADSVTINPLHWDPDEKIKIEIYKDIANVTHIVTIASRYGAQDSITYLGDG